MEGAEEEGAEEEGAAEDGYEEDAEEKCRGGGWFAIYFDTISNSHWFAGYMWQLIWVINETSLNSSSWFGPSLF